MGDYILKEKDCGFVASILRKWACQRFIKSQQLHSDFFSKDDWGARVVGLLSKELLSRECELAEEIKSCEIKSDNVKATDEKNNNMSREEFLGKMAELVSKYYYSYNAAPITTCAIYFQNGELVEYNGNSFEKTSPKELADRIDKLIALSIGNVG